MLKNRKNYNYENNDLQKCHHVVSDRQLRDCVPYMWIQAPATHFLVRLGWEKNVAIKKKKEEKLKHCTKPFYVKKQPSY